MKRVPLAKPIALVLVHTDSIDSYGWHVGKDRANELLDMWLLAIREHLRDNVGPVVLIRQGWDEPLATKFLEAVPKDRRVVTLKFDESTAAWDTFLPRLHTRLVTLGAKSAVVGGIWYRADETSGCATTVAVYLRKKMPTKVDTDLVGCEEDDE